MSFTYNKKNNGPSIDPCGTPHEIEYVFDLLLINETNCWKWKSINLIDKLHYLNSD